LGNPSPERAIAAWFQLLSDTAAQPGDTKGCFAINSLIEMAPHDPDVAKMLEYQYSRIGKLLETAIANGQKAGIFRRDLSTQQLQQMLLVTANGTLASSRAAFLKPHLPNITESVLAVLKA
jgi:TetR/AcrR family transcriptional regulator, transcriptional repressor for nem operon